MNPDKSSIRISLPNSLFVYNILRSIPFKAVHRSKLSFLSNPKVFFFCCMLQYKPFDNRWLFLLLNPQSEKLWAIRLLSVACLSLAAKMEELKVPMLSEFPLQDYNFGSKVIQRMELLVLSTLEWRMCSISPFDFLHFFITKLCKESPPSNIVSTAVEIILAIIRGTYELFMLNWYYCTNFILYIYVLMWVF